MAAAPSPAGLAAPGGPAGVHGMPRFVGLQDAGVSEQDIARLFEPFVAGGPADRAADAWAREVARRRRKIVKGAAARLLFGWLPATQRREATVVKEYNHAWGATDYGSYSVDAPRSRDDTPWEWRGRRLMASGVGGTRFRQLLLVRMIERVRPKTVLEVGCGNGINLLLLACRFPEIAFTGLELTDAGHRAAVAFQEQHERLPAPMEAFAPLPLPDPGGFRRVRFVQGSAAALPFDGGAFDLTFTVLALEQMERFRHRALGEVSRVTRGHTLMIEPFREVNSSLWPRLYIMRRNYFRGRIAELPRYGLEPVLAFDDFPQERFLRACAVLSRRRAA